MKRTAIALIALVLAMSSGAVAEGRAFVLERDDLPILYTFDGAQLTEPGEYLEIFSITDGRTAPEEELFAAQLLDSALEEDRLYAILDARGKRLTDFLYDWVEYDPESNALLVKWDGKTGAVSRSLAELLPCEYDEVLPDGRGGFLLSRATGADLPMVMHMARGGTPEDTGVRAILDPTSISEGLYVAEGEHALSGYLNGEGRWAIEPRFQSAEPFRGGCAVAWEEGRVGAIDRNGNWVVEPVYSYFMGILPDGGTVALQDADRIDFLSLPSGKLLSSIAPPEGSWASVDSKGHFFLLSGGDKSLLVDGNGAVILSLDGDWYLDDGLSDDPWPSADSAERPFLILGGDEDLLLDSAGKLLYRAQELEEASGVDNHALFITTRYPTHPVLDEDDGLYYDEPIEPATRYGLIDAHGNELLPTIYRALEPLIPGRFYAEDAQHWGVIDPTGKWIVSGSLYDQLMD